MRCVTQSEELDLLIELIPLKTADGYAVWSVIQSDRLLKLSLSCYLLPALFIHNFSLSWSYYSVHPSGTNKAAHIFQTSRFSCQIRPSKPFSELPLSLNQRTSHKCSEERSCRFTGADIIAWIPHSTWAEILRPAMERRQWWGLTGLLDETKEEQHTQRPEERQEW